MTDYGAPQSGGMGQMIQMISALAEMQDRRKRLAMDEHQMEVQQTQFAQQLGFNKESEQYKNATKLIDLATHGGAEGVTALYQLGKAMGLSEDQAQNISHVGMDAGSALQRVQANTGKFNLDQQQAGLASMGSVSPTPQQSAQQAAYLTQQAGGPNAMGQLGAGNLIAQMAGQAQNQITPGAPDFNAEMAKRVAQGFLIRTGTNQDPWGFAVGQAGINAGLAPAAASIAAGATPSAGQQLQAQSDMGRIVAEMAGSQAAASRGDLSAQGNILEHMHQISKDIADAKYANTDVRDRMIQRVQHQRTASCISGNYGPISQP
jgi:hypothetical protein